MRRQVAHLPLHGGKAPPWLFKRMHRLAGSIVRLIVEDQGPEEMLNRLADPFWFQAFGCVLGIDWHSSGLTTVTCGALKEAYRRIGDDLGVHVAGGKGGTSRKTPDEVTGTADRKSLDGERLVYASRMSAKVDSAAVQDGYQICSHFFYYSDRNEWCVVQQGMNDDNGYARRYHWLGSTVEDFVCEPHHGVASPPADAPNLLNMTAIEAGGARQRSTELTRISPDRLLRELDTGPSLFMPEHHPVLPTDINPKRLGGILRTLHEKHPADFENLLGTPEVGPKAIRSLALISQLIYGESPSNQDVTRRWSPTDPPTFSYAHGGKDGYPFPVDRAGYDRSINTLETALRRAQTDPAGRDEALFRLSRWTMRFDPDNALNDS